MRTHGYTSNNISVKKGAVGQLGPQLGGVDRAGPFVDVHIGRRESSEGGVNAQVMVSKGIVSW